MATAASRLTIRIALDPFSWRAEDKGAWAMRLAAAAEAAAPQLLSVDGYDMGDTMLYIRVHAREEPKRLKKLLRDDDRFKRLRARLADLGARAEFEIEAEEG